MKTLTFSACFALGLFASSAHADAINTFKTLCFENAGSVAAIRKAATNHGFKVNKLGKNSYLGTRASTDERVQINVFTKHSFECAVTTSDMPRPRRISREFLKSLGLNGNKGRARTVIDGRSYTVLHDTKGGEAFVIFAD